MRLSRIFAFLLLIATLSLICLYIWGETQRVHIPPKPELLLHERKENLMRTLPYILLGFGLTYILFNLDRAQKQQYRGDDDPREENRQVTRRNSATIYHSLQDLPGPPII